jgi:hypothetical protein
MLGSGAFDKLAMCQGAEETLMEKDKEQGDPGSLFRKRIGIAATAARDQPMRLHFTQIITQLIEGIGLLGVSVDTTFDLCPGRSGNESESYRTV